jgi:uncharacterized repeat protein (TIGR01451 family)
MLRRLLPIALLFLYARTLHAADLQAFLTATPEIRAGETTAWIIGAARLSGDETEWRIVFPIPEGTSFVSLIPHGVATCSVPAAGATTGTVDCSSSADLNYLDATFSVNLMALPTLTPGQTIHSSLTVTPTDPNPANNTAVADTLVVTKADLAGSGGGTGFGQAYVGDVIHLMYEAANVGPDPATDVVMDVTLPPQFTVASMSWNHGSCTARPVRCTVATLPKSDLTGEQIMILMLDVVPSTVGTYEIGYSASWSNPNFAPDPLIGLSEITVLPRPPAADLSLFVEAGPPSVAVGDLVTYTLHIANAGDAPASNVSIQQASSRAHSFVSSSANCNGGNDVSCVIGTLASGAWTTVTVTDRVLEPGSISSSFTLATTSAEGRTSNNTATATVNVTPAPVRRRATRH